MQAGEGTRRGTGLGRVCISEHGSLDPGGRWRPGQRQACRVGRRGAACQAGVRAGLFETLWARACSWLASAAPTQPLTAAPCCCWGCWCPGAAGSVCLAPTSVQRLLWEYSWCSPVGLLSTSYSVDCMRAGMLTLAGYCNPAAVTSACMHISSARPAAAKASV